MKKALIVFAIVMLAVVPACAGTWNVTFSAWTESPGPNLVNEKVLYNGVERCTVAAGAAKACAFTLPQTGPFGLPVVVRSYDSSSNFAEYTGPVLNPAVAPASGGTVIIQWVP